MARRSKWLLAASTRISIVLLDDIIDEEEKNGESVINKLEDEKSFVKLEYCDVELNAEYFTSRTQGLYILLLLFSS